MPVAKHFGRHGKKTRLTQEECDFRNARGKLMEDWWTDILPVQRSHPEKIDYPTQKPIALLDRIIRACTDEGGLVLDPFCGSGTTTVAAHLAGRRWVGIDASEDAVRVSRGRMATCSRLHERPAP